MRVVSDVSDASDAGSDPTVLAPTRPVQRGWPLWPILVAAIGVGGLLAMTWVDPGSDIDRLHLLNRYLARFSFVVFSLIFATSPLAAWLPGPATRRLLRLRRSLGLAYALIMAAHVAAILTLQTRPGAEPIDPLAGIVGGLGFVLIGALAATSSDAAVRRMGIRAWRRLHRTTLYFLWVIYAVTYAGRISAGMPEFAPGLVTLIGLALVRFSVRFRASASRDETALAR